MRTFKCNKCGENCTVTTTAFDYAGMCPADGESVNWVEVIPFNDDLFKRSDVPGWAKYATVQPDGHIIVYSAHPRWDSDQESWVPADDVTQDKVLNVFTDADDRTLLKKQAPKLSESIKPGDWLWGTTSSVDSSHYWQVQSINKDTGFIRIFRYGIEGYQHYDFFSLAQFDDSKYKPVKVNPMPTYDAYKLVGKIVRDSKKNAVLITEWCEEQGKLYMDMHAVTLEELTTWWLGDKPCGWADDCVTE